MCCKPKLKFIRRSLSKDKVYSIYLQKIDAMEKTITKLSDRDQDLAYEAAMDLGFKLFPIIDSISLNILVRSNGREYLKKLGYTGKESEMIYSMFRNGIMHTTNPYEFKFRTGIVSWGLISSSGSGGFTPYFPGYKSEENLKIDVPDIPAEKAFTLEKSSDGIIHANLSLDRLAAQIRFDLTERQKTDKRKEINIIVGQIMEGEFPYHS